MPQQFPFPETFWAGTQSSLDVAIEAHNQIMAGPFDREEPEDSGVPYNVSVSNGVAVIEISGSLSNSSSPYARYYGVTTYSAIREAAIYAAGLPEVGAILLDIKSGGGAVSGVDDTAKLLASIDKGVKPVYAVTDSVMASAAYWLGASARKIYASSTATVGSIGVITTHMEYSKALKDEGVGVSVVRSGEHKALVNSVEPLTSAARTQLQSHLDGIYAIFIEHVADGRKTTVAQADSRMGQGREFLGKDAMAAGLIDGVESFDKVFGDIAAKLLDNSRVTQNNNRNYMGSPMPRQALTEQDIAAIAAGATVASLEAPADEVVVPAAQTPETPAAPAAAAPAPEAAPAAAAPAPEAANAIVQYLQAEIKTAQEQAVDLRVQLAAANAKILSMEATHAGLAKIAAQSVTTMRVALNMASVDFSAATPESLLAEHASAQAAFTSAFRVGGVAAVPSAQAATTAAPKQDAMAAARRASVTNGK